MKTILQLLEKAGGYRRELYVRVENPPYQPLVIEAIPEPGPLGLRCLSVAHYGEQNGDLMRDLVNEGAEGFRWRLAGKQNDLASVAHTQRRGNALFVLKQDVLGCDEVEQTFHALSDIATDAAGKLGKLQTFCLRDIEDIHGTEAD